MNNTSDLSVSAIPRASSPGVSDGRLKSPTLEDKAERVCDHAFVVNHQDMHAPSHREFEPGRWLLVAYTLKSCLSVPTPIIAPPKKP